MSVSTTPLDDCYNVFWDIESLTNVFSIAAYHHNPNDETCPKKLELYILVDDAKYPQLKLNNLLIEDIKKRTYESNHNFPVSAPIYVYDLHDSANVCKLMKLMGLSTAKSVNDINDASLVPAALRPVCDTDTGEDNYPEYDAKKDPYIFGFNSKAYDTTMLAVYFANILRKGCNNEVPDRSKMSMDQFVEDIRDYCASRDPKHTITAQFMRETNDRLFTGAFHKSMQRYLYVANKMSAMSQSDLESRWKNTDIDPTVGTDERPPQITNDFNAPEAAIRRAWIACGRHLDVMVLNEHGRMGLKRLLGMLGAQILESDKLSSRDSTLETAEQLSELMAYNASDVINLEIVLKHPVYEGQFDLKRGLLSRYPELIYKNDENATGTSALAVFGGEKQIERPNNSIPVESPDMVKPNRMTIDSRSAQLASNSLCPYGSLNDLNAVSFQYPSKAHLADVGLTEQFNVLQMAWDMINELYPSHIDENGNRVVPEPVKAFEKVYHYYGAIEGLNFNDSERYNKGFVDSPEGPEVNPENPPEDLNDYRRDEQLGLDTVSSQSAQDLKRMSATITIPYFDKFGNPTSCFAVFSTGGIHGQEDNLAVWNAEAKNREKFNDALKRIMRHYGLDADVIYDAQINDYELDENTMNQMAQAALEFRKERKVTLDGETYEFKHYLASGFVIKRPETHKWRAFKKPPRLFETKRRTINGSMKDAIIIVPEKIGEKVDYRGPNITVNLPANRTLNIDMATSLTRPLGFKDDEELYDRHAVSQNASGWLERDIVLGKNDLWFKGELIDNNDDVVKNVYARKCVNGIVVYLDHESGFTSQALIIPRSIDGESKSLRETNETDTDYRIRMGHSVQWPVCELSTISPILVTRVESTELKASAYGYTSMDATSHEDFTSYYPNMLRMMSAFYNPQVGYDRYEEIFMDKERFGKLRKDKSLSQAQRDFYSVQREGTKLILNSASGAGDTASDHNSPIQMNNRIISMRMIGQLFSWMIGQFQAYHGAKITSTNTDGLYSAMASREENDRLLAEKSADIGVPIEPEPMILISKDSNNRIELSDPSVTGKPIEILTASGGSLSCYRQPQVTKALAHAAVIDTMVAEYLRIIARAKYESNAPYDADTINLNNPADKDVLKDIFKNMPNICGKDMSWTLRMMGTMLASSPSSQIYIFGSSAPRKENNELSPSQAADKMQRDIDSGDITIMQHYNRAFFIKEQFIEYWRGLGYKVVYIEAVAPQTLRGKTNVPHVPGAAVLFSQYDSVASVEAQNRRINIRKVNGIDPAKPVLIYNNTLEVIDNPNYSNKKELLNLYNSLDMDEYVDIAAATFDDNWRNAVVE